MIVIYAIRFPKKSIIIWMTARMLFNAQVSLRFSPPAMSLTIAVDMTLLCLYYFKLRYQKNKLNQESFIFNDIMKGLLISYLLSFVFSAVPYGIALNQTIKYFVSNIGMLYILHKCLQTRTDVYLYFYSACIVAVLISALGLYESIVQDNPIQDWIYMNTPHDETTLGRCYYVPPSIRGALSMRFGMVRAYSFFGIHIAFGCACIFLLYMMGMVLKYQLTSQTSKKNIIIIILLLGGVLASNSKTPLIGLIILLLGFYQMSSFFKPVIIIPTLIVITIISVYFPEYLQTFFSIYDADLAVEGGGSSLELRERQLAVTWELFLRSPIIGNGLGSLAYFRGTGESAGILGAESSLFQILPERGIIGMCVYFYIFISLYQKCKSNIPHRELLFFLMAVLAMDLVTGQTDMSLWGGVLITVNKLFVLKRQI